MGQVKIIFVQKKKKKAREREMVAHFILIKKLTSGKINSSLTSKNAICFFFLINKEDLKLRLRSYMVTLPPQKKLCIQVRGDSFVFSEQRRMIHLFLNPLSSFTIVAIKLLNVLVFKIEQATNNANPTFALNV